MLHLAPGSSLGCPLSQARISQKNQCLTGVSRQASVNTSAGVNSRPKVPCWSVGLEYTHLTPWEGGEHLAAGAKGKWARTLWGSQGTPIFLGALGI